MIKLISKATFLTLFACCTAIIARAQLGYNYSQYDIGFAVGLNSVYGDAETSPMRPAAHFNITYNTTPYINFVFEGQGGQMAGGSINTKSGREFESSFFSFQIRGQLQAGELMDYS